MIKSIYKPTLLLGLMITSFIGIIAETAHTASATPSNILYLNSTRGSGTSTRGNFRSAIAGALDSYNGGGIFDVTFVQTHVAGNLASFINSNPIDFYDQIWFDTTILETSILNNSDLVALNAWASFDQPEFILDSSFFARNGHSSSISTSAANATINEALALRDAGGGIFIGTDHNSFANTANQILRNFGFDDLFTGLHNITSDGGFIGDLLTSPLEVGPDFFTNHLEGLSTSNTPTGTQVLNANGGNRTIELQEALFSNSPGRITHISASFDPGSGGGDITDPPAPIPQPGTLGMLGIGLIFLGRHLKKVIR